MPDKYFEYLKNLKGSFAVEGMVINEETEELLRKLFNKESDCVSLVDSLVKQYSQAR